MKTSSTRVLSRLLSRLRSLAREQRALRLDITRHHHCDRLSHLTQDAILSGRDSDVRRFLLNALNPPGKILDLSTLSEADFERFRSYYSECWDPPDAPPLDLSFLDSPAPPLSPTAVPFDISGDCSGKELLDALKFLRRGKAPGPSGLPVVFYKYA